MLTDCFSVRQIWLFECLRLKCISGGVRIRSFYILLVYLYSWWASPGSPALPITRNRRYAGDEANGRCIEEISAWNLNWEAPSCLDGAGMRICWRTGLHTLTAETDRGPEGSRLTVGNCRLRGCGVEKRIQSTGVSKMQQPEACSSL